MKCFNGVNLTENTIQETRQWFHDNALACIREVEEGKVFVNNREHYIDLQRKSAREYIKGKHDHILAFLQRAHYIQTGESVALMP
ncbi:hypothetical protein GCM10008931_43360 [Oceanobacillus oncorhynchi subsp. oncorhynchi]|uniref:hypothetical protein n=1 Tax=Oceanobacillus oncorhynchi TaxID=545501 RepID=UPI0031CE7214